MYVKSLILICLLSFAGCGNSSSSNDTTDSSSPIIVLGDGNSQDDSNETNNTVDSTPPIITLNGEASTVASFQGIYTDAGATASDNHDTQVQVTHIGEVNTSKMGIYTITYHAQDAAGNLAQDINRTIEVLNNYGTLTGIVRDTNNQVLSNARITVDGKTFLTNAQGYFAFDEIIDNPTAVVKVETGGYVTSAEFSTIRRGLNDQIEITLSPYTFNDIINPSMDINISHMRAFVNIPTNALVYENGQTASGNIHLQLTPFDPTDTEEVKAFPGDFIGIRTDGSRGALQSFGFMDVSITDENGTALNLANGMNADIGIPIPASLQATAPISIPLWHFNTTTAQWEEQGTLIRNGAVYTGSVTHFSTWNAGFLYESAFVKGTLMNCETNTSITCGRVLTKGAQNEGWESEERCTQDDGSFRISVMPDSNALVFGSKNGAVSIPYTFTAPIAGETLDIGPVCVKNPVIRITLTWDAQPDDLDSHLTFDGEDGRKMVYFSHEVSSLGSIQLDTDDTNGFGPEIITINTLKNGVYRYSVHHYSGSQTISTSGAVLNMVVDETGNGDSRIQRLEPLTGAIGDNDVWLAWDIVVEDGQITSILPLQSYLHSIGDSNTAAFSPNYSPDNPNVEPAR